ARSTEHRTQEIQNLTPEERLIVSALSLEPKHIDSISIETKLPIPQVSSLLLMLEVKKFIRQLPGKMYVVF
ncbi:DNA-protecting protein DprA, partial [Candidatus Margulisiibacteriota bacterium]